MENGEWRDGMGSICHFLFSILPPVTALERAPRGPRHGRRLNDAAHVPGRHAVSRTEQVVELDRDWLRDAAELALDCKRCRARDDERLLERLDLEQLVVVCFEEILEAIRKSDHLPLITKNPCCPEPDAVGSRPTPSTSFPPPTLPRWPALVGHWAHSAIVDALVLSYAPGGARPKPIRSEQHKNRTPHPRRFAGGALKRGESPLGAISSVEAPSCADARVNARGERVWTRASEACADWNASAFHSEGVRVPKRFCCRGANSTTVPGTSQGSCLMRSRGVQCLNRVDARRSTRRQNGRAEGDEQ